MRHLVTPVLLGMLLVLAIPAGAAKPTSTDVVTWSVDGGTVTLDTDGNEVSVILEGEAWVECAGASALAVLQWTGTAPADIVDIDRRGSSGSFSGTVELASTVVVGGCADYVGEALTSSVSGDFVADKGKAVRWRDEVGRHIQRAAAGTISVASYVDEPASVTATRTISR